MKTSELIDLLDECKRQFGDKEVSFMVYDRPGSEDDEFTLDVAGTEYDGEKIIIIDDHRMCDNMANMEDGSDYF